MVLAPELACAGNGLPDPLVHPAMLQIPRIELTAAINNLFMVFHPGRHRNGALWSCLTYSERCGSKILHPSGSEFELPLLDLTPNVHRQFPMVDEDRVAGHSHCSMWR